MQRHILSANGSPDMKKYKVYLDSGLKKKAAKWPIENRGLLAKRADMYT